MAGHVPVNPEHFGHFKYFNSRITEKNLINGTIESFLFLKGETHVFHPFSLAGDSSLFHLLDVPIMIQSLKRFSVTVN